MEAPCNHCVIGQTEPNLIYICCEDCPDFFEYVKKVLSITGSPCRDFRCNMPKRNEDKNKCLKKCPLAKIYYISLGKGDPSYSGGI